MRRPETIRAIADPAARVKAAQAALAESQRLTVEYSTIARDTVRDMRETMSYGQIAAVLGVSRTRVQQLAK